MISVGIFLIVSSPSTAFFPTLLSWMPRVGGRKPASVYQKSLGAPPCLSLAPTFSSPGWQSKVWQQPPSRSAPYNLNQPTNQEPLPAPTVAANICTTKERLGHSLVRPFPPLPFSSTPTSPPPPLCFGHEIPLLPRWPFSPTCTEPRTGRALPPTAVYCKDSFSDSLQEKKNKQLHTFFCF